MSLTEEQSQQQQRIQNARRGFRELAARSSNIVDPGHRSILLTNPDQPPPPIPTTADQEFDDIVDRFFNRLESLLAERNSRRGSEDPSRQSVPASNPAWQSLIRAHAQIRAQLPPAEEDSGVTMHGRTVANRLSAAAAAAGVSDASDHPNGSEPSTSRHPFRPTLERLQLPGSSGFTPSERPVPPAFRSARTSRSDTSQFGTRQGTSSSSGRLSLLSNQSMFQNFSTPTSSVIRDSSMLFDEPTSFITAEPERRRSSLIPPEAIEGRNYTLIRRLDEQGEEVVSQVTLPPEPVLQAGGSRRHRPVNDPFLHRRRTTTTVDLNERHTRPFDPHFVPQTRLVLDYESEDEFEDPRVRLPSDDGFGNFEITREMDEGEEILFIGSAKPFKANPLPMPLPGEVSKPGPKRPPMTVSRQSSLAAR